jgi:putative ATP-dependent endonuclease of OLD family
MAEVRKVTIERFRNLEQFVWNPSSGVNVLVGPGDTGKSTVLSALSLFARRRSLSEFDYLKRRTHLGFLIDIVVTGLSVANFAFEKTQLPIRGWDGHEVTSLPEDGAEPALVLRAQGTPELELEYYVVAESGDLYNLSATLRQELTVLFLARTDDGQGSFRADSGSLLGRNFADVDFRSPAQAAIQLGISSWASPAAAEADLLALRDEFRKLGLPAELILGMVLPATASAAKSVTALQGAKLEESVPLELAGDGTRNLSALLLVSRLMTRPPILLIDEVESGLEPHRQRVAAKLITRMHANGAQAIVVTHSPSVVQAMGASSHWQMAPAGPLPIPPRLISGAFHKEPEAAFARMSLVCEGRTEVGMAPVFWTHYVGVDIEECGTRVLDAIGHAAALGVLEDLLAAKMPCAGFVDNEPDKSGTRATLAAQCPLFTWDPLTMPEEAIAMWTPFDGLEAILSEIRKAKSERYAHSQLMARINQEIPGSTTGASLGELRDSHGEQTVRAAVCKVLRADSLLKNSDAGAAAAHWYVRNGIPAQMDAILKPFFEKFSSLRQ